MANNITVKDATGTNTVMKTTEADGIHTAHHIPEGELIEAVEALRNAVQALTRTIGLSIPDASGRLRVSADVVATHAVTQSGSWNIATTTTVSAVTNQTQMGGIVAVDQIPALMHISADSLRRNITVS
jgi:hypothetical protein